MTLRKLLAGLVLGIGSALIVLGLDASGWLTPLESKTYDWRIRAAVSRPPAVNRDIVLVEINDTTIHDLAPFFGRWPWPRLAMATLVDFLNRAPAKVIAIDVTFLEPQRHISFRVGEDGPDFTGEKSDAMLADAIRAKGNVILLADAVYLGTTGGEQANAPAAWAGSPYKPGPAVEEIPLVVPPFQSLTDAAATLGHNFLALDPDGPARRMPPFVRVGDKYLPSLGVAAALMADGAARGRRHPRRGAANRKPRDAAAADQGRGRERSGPRARSAVDPDQLPRAGAGRRHPAVPLVRGALSVEAEDQIQRGEKPDLDPAIFKDKIVFVGLTALRSGRRLPDAVRQQLMPGIQLHASIADSILSNRFIRPAAVRTGVLAVARRRVCSSA